MRIPEGCNYTPIKMRILLDAKDLIDIVEHVRPISVERFGEWLREKGATAVLSFTNINDFVGPTFENNTFLDMRPLLQRIETLPLSYIREGTIIASELREAVAAYKEGREPVPVDPYVRRWDETGFWLNESAARILVGMRLDDLVRMASTSIQIYKRFNPGIKDYLRKESEIPNAERWSLKEIFINRMPDRFAAHKLNADGIDIPRFCNLAPHQMSRPRTCGDTHRQRLPFGYLWLALAVAATMICLRGSYLGHASHANC